MPDFSFSDISDIVKKLSESIYQPWRIVALIDKLFPELTDCKTCLDYGCGDGSLAKTLQDMTGCIFSGVDPVPRDKSYIPVTKITPDQKLPFSDNSFDAVMFIDVLHHIKDYLPPLQEAIRIASRKIIIKDHYYGSQDDYYKLCLADFTGNAIYGVNLPFNYKTMQQWTELFGSLPSLNLKKATAFKIGGPDICNHVLFVLEKQ